MRLTLQRVWNIEHSSAALSTRLRTSLSFPAPCTVISSIVCSSVVGISSLLRPVTFMVVMLSAITGFKEFAMVQTLTNGGPASATTTLAVLSYDEAFVNYNYGSGAAVTTVWLLLMVVVVFVFNAIFRKKDD